MKKFLIRSAVFLLTFGITLVVASRIINKDHDNMTMDMAQATLPVLTMFCGDIEYNPLYGYVTLMETASQRDSITVLGENRNVTFRIKTYGRHVSKMVMQLRSGDGSRLIENTELEGYQETDGEIRLEVALKDLIEKDQEYVLSIGLELDGWQEAWYQTRAIWNPDSHLEEDLAYVLDFHQKLYNREEARSLIKYLESNSKLEDNSSFHKVNIHSSFKQITWGDMKVRETRAPRLTVKELTNQFASILVDYAVDALGSDRDTHYRMQEYYRVRYTADRMYLLAYERTMTQIPDEDALWAGDKLLLGIADENVDMMENEDGSVVAFQQADRLFSYKVSNQRLALIFSFYDLTREDVRDEHDEHDVKILGVDQDGNVDFAVYGYMNRGEHEGEVGVRICRYDAGINTVSEIVFIPWNRPYSNLRVQMEELIYLNQEGKLYLSLENAIYRVDLQEKTYERVLDVFWDGSMRVSADHRILVWQENARGEYSNEIKIRDLLEESQTSIRGSYGDALKIMGFMGQDLVFGVAKRSQTESLGTGREFFPAYKICIAKADGTILKEYTREGIYVTGCEVEENQIVLERVQQKEDGGFVAIGQDHITKTQQAKTGKNRISVVDIDVYERYVQIQVNGKIDAKKVQLLTPKEVIHEGSDSLLLEAVSPVERFFVYGPYGLAGRFVQVRNAVELAGEISGCVVSENGTIVWQKGSRASRNQIMAIREPEKVGKEASLAVCLDAMLRFRGITVNSSALLEQGKQAADVLRENLTDVSVADMTGCSLDSMLYYVNRDVPVLALLSDGEAVLVTGFNESQVVIFEPSSGRLYKRGTNDAGKWFEENGNCFFTFFP